MQSIWSAVATAALVGRPPSHTLSSIQQSSRCAHIRCQAISGGSYKLRLAKPLGIAFEEVAPGKPEGVVVADLVEGGNADIDGRILVGDKLLRCSAVSFAGKGALLSLGDGKSQFTSFQRDLIPATELDFETIMSAIQSNEGRYGYTDVVLELMHTHDSVPRVVSATDRAARRDGVDVQWDGARGTRSNGKSTPLRPTPDNFDMD